MQYRIISVSTVFSGFKALEKFIKEVNEAIALGWEPQGGVAFTGNRFIQAMVKRR
jgi:hypothetical protein